ncbi:MAG: hypothetical protein JEZ04_13625 [Spirochaetales bacterium]|nr:hypothetical protein [Spirochaetales bacterium]
MVVVSFKRLMISLLMIITVTLMLIVCGLAVNGGEFWYLKIEFQNFMFWGIIALIVQLWICGSLLLSHRKIMKTINRLSSFDDLNSMNAEKSFREMGELGEEIKTVLRKVNQLSVMRAERISALNNLVYLLCEGYSEPVIVTDVKGDIFTISDKFKGRIAKNGNSTVINNIIEIRPELKLSEVLGFIEKQRSAWNGPENSGLVCTPVFDKNSTVQFCIWEFETSFFSEKLKELNQQKSKIQPSYKKLMDFIKLRQKRKK